MFALEQYELVDFGNERKLERFGPYLLDRPCPAARESPELSPAKWKEATARFVRKADQEGTWQGKQKLQKDWQIEHVTTHGTTQSTVKMQLKPTAFGHVGLFPEQAANWDWISNKVANANRTPRVLNLFAYTGGSTLAAAAAGAEVVHVDSSKTTVQWARENAKLSGLEDAPIQWIVEDAQKYADRELRRGNQYDGIILDPPSYGHGPKGEVWKISEQLFQLLDTCAKLTAKNRLFLLLTCHTPGYGPAELSAYLSEAMFGNCQSPGKADPLYLRTKESRRVNSGSVIRWPY